MSTTWSSEQIACILDDVRQLARCAAAHEETLQALVRKADTDVRDAERALIDARDCAADTPGEWQRACSARVDQTRYNADATIRACVSAREQHVAARRLLRRMGAEAAEHEKPVPDGHATAVLVVDDVEDTRELVAFLLRNAGFIVRTAINGLDALIAAYEMRPSVIVMDMTMPVLDGMEATRLIKATEFTRHAKVIAYTGNASLRDVMVDRLFVAVLPKPSTPSALLATVQSAASL